MLALASLIEPFLFKYKFCFFQFITDLDGSMIRFSSDQELELALKERSCFSYNTLNIFMQGMQQLCVKLLRTCALLIITTFVIKKDVCKMSCLIQYP